MSLLIYPYKRNSKTNTIERLTTKPTESQNELFGFENWRKTVWGSNTLKDLNCDLLCSLKHKDIYAENENILLLKNEIEILKKNIPFISIQLKIDKKSFEFRLDNALEAIRIAMTNPNYGVYIG